MVEEEEFEERYKMSTTMYRLRQLELRMEARDTMVTNALKEMMERIVAIDARQLVHMKQTDIAERTNDKKMDTADKKMDSVSEQLDSLASRVSNQNTEHIRSITGLQVQQTFLEKFGPGGGAGAAVAAIIVGVTELILKLSGSK